MKATLIHGARDVRVETVPDPTLQEPTDAIVRVTGTAVCGSDLRPWASWPADLPPSRIGHEFVGVVEETGSQVRGFTRGDLVVVPFAFADNTCTYCRRGLHTSCPRGGVWSLNGADGAHAEAVRVQQAEGTMVKIPATADPALLPSLVALSDVFSTGHHAAHTAGVSRGDSVTVVGDGAVGLLAVLAARRLGAEQIVLMGRHRDRTDLGREFGATDVVAERGEEGVARVRELTGGLGTDRVLEAVGTRAALDMSIGAATDGGVISRVGVPQQEQAPIGAPGVFFRNLTFCGGPAPVRAYLEELLPDVLEGRLQPGRVFDRTVSLDRIAEGYRAMADRDAIKVLVTP